MVLSIVPLVFAEDEPVPTLYDVVDDEADDIEDEDDIEDISVIINEEPGQLNIGSQIRMLQLEKQIQKNIYFGTEVMNYLEDTLSEASAILEEMNSLLTTIQSYVYEGKTNEQLAEDFVAYKKQSRDLTKQYRELTKPEVTPEEAKLTREALKDLEKTVLDSVNEQIRNLIRERNANRYQHMLEKMGAKNEELLEKIRNGATKKEALDFAKGKFKEMNKENKEKFLEETKKKRAELKDKKQEAKAKSIQKAKAKAIKFKLESKKRIDALKKQVKNKEQQVSSLREKLKTQAEKQKERIKTRTEEQKERLQQAKLNQKENLQERKEATKANKPTTDNTVE